MPELINDQSKTDGFDLSTMLAYEFIELISKAKKLVDDGDIKASSKQLGDLENNMKLLMVSVEKNHEELAAC